MLARPPARTTSRLLSRAMASIRSGSSLKCSYGGAWAPQHRLHNSLRFQPCCSGGGALRGKRAATLTHGFSQPQTAAALIGPRRSAPVFHALFMRSNWWMARRLSSRRPNRARASSPRSIPSRFYKKQTISQCSAAQQAETPPRFEGQAAGPGRRPEAPVSPPILLQSRALTHALSRWYAGRLKPVDLLVGLEGMKGTGRPVVRKTALKGMDGHMRSDQACC